MTLPASAAERRPLQHGARPQLPIDTSYPQGAQQQTRRPSLLLSIDGADEERRDGRTDGHPTVT